MLVASPLDLQKNELRQPQVHNLASAPASPVKGQLYFDTTANKLYYWNGSAWVDCSGAGAAPSDATTSSKGIVQLAGDLAGTAASPQIAAGVITDTDVNSANKDGAVGVASMRTIGTGAQQAMAGNTRLDTIAAPTATVNMAGQSISNLPATPSGALDAASKTYVDNTAAGLDAKASVKAASTANLTLSGTQTVDGIALVANDRILVKDQTTQSGNGIYLVASGAWTRATDMDSWAEVPGSFVWVEQGTAGADTGWVCTADQGGTLGTTSITWAQFSAGQMVVAGAGIQSSGGGRQFDITAADSTMTIGADTIAVATGGITGTQLASGAVDLTSAKVTGALGLANGGTGQTTAKAARETGLAAAGYYSSATHGAGTTITITQATHGLRASRGLMVQARLEATGEEVLCDNSVAANGDVTLTFAVSQSANTIRAVVIG